MTKNKPQKNTLEGWGLRKLGNLFDIKRGGSPRPISQYITDAEDGLNWLKIGDIKPGAKYIDSTTSKIKKEGLQKTTLVRKGDFILSNSMSFGRPYILNIETCIHDGWLTFQDIKTDILDRNFLYFLLLHPKTQNTFKNISAGSGVQNLKKETVAEVRLLFPSTKEQKRIVAVLEVWDEMIEKLERKIEVKKNIKKGLMQQLLTAKKRLPGFGGEWKEKKLGEVGKTYQGITGKTKEDFTDKKEFGMPFISYMNIYSNSKVNVKGISTFVKLEKTHKQNSVKYGDIFFTTSSETPNEVGMSSVLLSKNIDNLYLNSFSFGFRLKDFKFIIPDFAEFYFSGQGFRKKMTRIAQGASRFNLSKKYFLDTNVKAPKNLKEQKAIAEILTTADEEIEKLGEKLWKIKDQKKFLLNNLVTGEIRVLEK